MDTKKDTVTAGGGGEELAMVYSRHYGQCKSIVNFDTALEFSLLAFSAQRTWVVSEYRSKDGTFFSILSVKSFPRKMNTLVLSLYTGCRHLPLAYPQLDVNPFFLYK